jgi:TrpR-related protein YerC/YecD
MKKALNRHTQPKRTKLLGAKNPAPELDLMALCDAFLNLKNREECRRFLNDLCTRAEISTFAERLRIARLLYNSNKSYREIHSETGTSVTTIGRVARSLLQEKHKGYQLVIQRITKKKS